MVDDSSHLMVDDSAAAAFAPYALQRAAKRRPYSRPEPRYLRCALDFRHTIGERKREVAARADESEYLSGKKAGIILVRAGMASVAAGAPCRARVLPTLNSTAHICS